MISDQLGAELLTATVFSLWIGGLLAIGAGLLIRSLDLRPATRCRVWALVLGAAVAAPLARVASRQAESAAVSVSEPDEPRPAPITGETRAAGEPSPGTEEGSSAIQQTRSESSAEPALSLNVSLGMAILLAWMLGSIVNLAWLAFQVSRLVNLKKNGSHPGPSLNRIWSELSASRTRRRIRLLLSARSQLPAACGYFRPAIIAPAQLCSELNEEEIRHLLLHELAHLNRYDDWGLLVHRTIQVILWWHPVVWYVSRRLDAEREIVCDEIVVSGGDRRRYARTLVRVAEVARGRMVEMAPGILRGDLTRRIESLLHITGPVKRAGRARAGALAASTLAVALVLTPPTIRLGLKPGSVPGVMPDRRPAIAAHLDSAFAGYADSGFAGSVLVAMGDSIILARGYGMADRERGIPATAETRYSVAGFTKMFTAAAVLTLEQEGKLRITDSLARLFGPLPGSDGAVTLDQLLTHTDGLTRQNAPVYRSDPLQFIRAVSASPDSFAPGQGYRYNDFGHSVLGVIVEQVSGTRYEDFIRDRFLGPAGLTHTGFENDGDEDYAVEYAGPPGKQHPIPPRTYTWGRRGSLGMVSTVGDMYRWVRSLDDPRVIPAEVRKQMFQVHGPTDWGAQRGYGWDRVRQQDGTVLWRRVAGTPGMEGEILHDPTRNWTAVILVNSRVEWRFRVWKDIADAINGIGLHSDQR